MTKIERSGTAIYDPKQLRSESVRKVMGEVSKSLAERGFNPNSQLAGYLISNDPAYITSHNGARNEIQSVERQEILEELLHFYLEH